MSITHSFNPDLFIKAFRTGFGTSSITICNCGRAFNNLSDEDLQSGLGMHLTMIRFESKEYVDMCDCWHERASKIQGFIMSHSKEIVGLIKLHVESAERAMPNKEDLNSLESNIER